MDKYTELISTFLDTGSFSIRTLDIGRHLSRNPLTIPTFLAQQRWEFPGHAVLFMLPRPLQNVSAI